ncbi:MAG TPA: insulinase family protein, partial [Alphaproteobacteria bacterium]|nr:insulinase family protein [Alphaproteobacteria bacterium]
MTRILLRLGRLVSIFCLVFTGQSVLAQTVSNPTPLDFQIETFVLSNGLQVVVMPSNRAPIVTQMLLYRVGSADEESGKSGLAHFLEHLLFKATK